MRTPALDPISSGKPRWAERTIADFRAPGPAPAPAWAHPSHRSTVETDDVVTRLTPALVDDAGTWLTSALDRHRVATGRVADEPGGLDQCTAGACHRVVAGLAVPIKPARA